MTRRRITIEVDGMIAVVRGWLAHKLAVEAGLRPTFSGLRSGWVFDTKRLPDLVAHLERRRFGFDVQGDAEGEVSRDRDVHRGDDQLDRLDVEAELPLFDLGSR